MPKISYCVSKGFTLLEILVSTIILAVGLLGLAAMQTLALKDNQDAFFYAQASSLAYEMSDRIKVNATIWKNPTLPSDTPCNKTCDFNAPCDTSEMATFDYCAWQANVKNRISPEATAIVSISDNSGTGVCGGPASKRCLTISWLRSHQQGTTAANNTFQLEVTP